MTKKKIAVKKVATVKKDVEKKSKEKYIMIDSDYGVMKFNSEEEIKKFILKTVVEEDGGDLDDFMADNPVFIKGVLLNLNIETVISITEQ